ncbi:out at first protein [Cloeon dipterum]|uniref:out at first protein n=1 Tax=Cloeon dipterum TaxID=197152 RepID=UPI0032207EFA
MRPPWWLVRLLAGLLVVLGRGVAPQLLINVKNQGGDVLQETIAANMSEEWVSLEFQRSDGTLVTQMLDFKNEVEILKALILGEEERGQSQYQVMCFVSHFDKSEGFISPDAMAKLRQKNPSTVRTPEEDRGRQNTTMDGLLDLFAGAKSVSALLPTVCAEAKDATYAPLADLKIWSEHAGKDLTQLLKVVPKKGAEVTPRCAHVSDTWRHCMCHLELCIGWYPCGLKFCKSKDNSGKLVSYRCGIKTCRKCRLFEYPVRQKQLCLWDE